MGRFLYFTSFDSILLQINIHKTAMTALCILHNDEITKILQNCPTFHKNILDQSSVNFVSCSITAKQWANVNKREFIPLFSDIKNNNLFHLSSN